MTGHAPGCPAGSWGGAVRKGDCPLCRAAPDLLAALKEAVAWLNRVDPDEYAPWHNPARAAIARAEGKGALADAANFVRDLEEGSA